MAISALARAGVLFDEPHWTEAANTLYAFVKTHMFKGGRLHHTWCAGQGGAPIVSPTLDTGSMRLTSIIGILTVAVIFLPLTIRTT